MEFELGTAIIAGIVGTGVMTIVMAMGSMMGMGMDIPRMLGTMFFPRGAAARVSGLILHVMMGAVFFIIYAALFDALEIEDAIVGWSALFGVVHGLMAGAAMGMVGAMHPRMGTEAGSMPPPGFMGLRISAMAPIAILAVHAIFGAVGGFIYQA